MREFDLIQWIREQSQDFPATVVTAIGDDCALLDPASAGRLAVTTDSLIEETHFRRRWTSPRFLGEKALAVNVSDLAAVGARPWACLLNLALPEDLSDAFVRSLIDGFLQACRRWECPLIGGNLSRSSELHIAVTAWGTLGVGQPVLRSGASPGDRLAVIGSLGQARRGLQLLQSEDPDLSSLSSDAQLRSWAESPQRWRCLRALLRPSPPVAAGVWLRQQGLASAMIDVSDGLSSDLMHLLRASGLAAEIDCEALLDVLPESLPSERKLDTVLSGGEDYALLFSLSSRQLSRLESDYPRGFPRYRLIGELTAGQPEGRLRRCGQNLKIEASGFEHFQ